MKQTTQTTHRSSEESKTGDAGGEVLRNQPPQGGMNTEDQSRMIETVHDNKCPADTVTDFAGQPVHYCPVCRVQIWPKEGDDMKVRLASERDPYCVVRRQAARRAATAKRR
jgi:hypothetical protein